MDEIKFKVKKIEKKKDFMRRLAMIYKASQKPALYFAKRLGKRLGSGDFACNLMIPYSMAMEEESNCYVTYDLHPKKAEDYNEWLYYARGGAGRMLYCNARPLTLGREFYTGNSKILWKVLSGH